MKIQVSSEEFKLFINAISAVFRGGATLKIHKEYIESVVIAEDSASIIGCARINIINSDDINLNVNEEYIINIPDMSKFSKLLSMCDKDIFEFEIKKNYVYFKSDRVHGAKFILNDIPAQKIDKRYTSKWFDMFKPKYTTKLNKKILKELLHVSSFADGSDKIYFFQKDNDLIAECNDRTLDNIDNISLVLSSDGQGIIENNVIIAVDTLSAIIAAGNEFDFNIVKIGNATISYEALLLATELNGVSVKYFVNTKRQ